ncbi:MAG: hypothetical protein ACRYF2_15580 [Janthinobacterium lividum]
MIRPSYILIVAAALPVLVGCNTISRGTTQTLTITSDPDGANCSVEQGGRLIGKVEPTPGTLIVQRSLENLRITCTKPGYNLTTINRFSMRTDFQSLGIFAAGNLVDLSSGANNSYPSTTRIALTLTSPPD